MKFASRNSDYLPRNYYNIKADLPSLPKPPLHPATGQPLSPADLEPIFTKGYIAQETTLERDIPIPEAVLEAYSVFRPTPLNEATALEKYLDTPARIFYKYEGAGPVGSHKTNSAIPQAYMAAKEGITTLTTETGAGQWGTALAYAGSKFGIDTRIFMVRSSAQKKAGRLAMMRMFGGTVSESPGPDTAAGRKYYDQDHNHPGSLGMAISEAVETAASDPGTKYVLGSVLDAVLMHQTIIGQEAQKQMAELGADPDTIIGCVGGGSNFGGLAFPYAGLALREKKDYRFITVEPESCPSLTQGELRYDNGDSAGLVPLLFMHTLGRDFVPPALHAGGLRYHGMSPLISHLVSLGLVAPRSVAQQKAFEAGVLFLRTEGILPAPESSHAVAAAIDEAVKAREEKKPRVILFNLSGHGFLDIAAYDGSRP